MLLYFASLLIYISTENLTLKPLNEPFLNAEFFREYCVIFLINFQIYELILRHIAIISLLRLDTPNHVIF